MYDVYVTHLYKTSLNPFTMAHNVANVILRFGCLSDTLF